MPRCERACAHAFRDRVDTVVDAVRRAGFATVGLRLFARAPSEETMLALRAALAADGGVALAAMLEAINMEEIDEDDLDDDDDD